jgi:hypothetical protein
MILGINLSNEIVAVGTIPEGLTIIEVSNDTFIDKDPTQYKIQVGDNWQEITPRYLTHGL